MAIADVYDALLSKRVYKPPMSYKEAAAKGVTAEVTGKVIIEKNTYYLEDERAEVTYNFVGLDKDQKSKLSALEGRTITVQLKVVSERSAGARNANLIEIISS